MSIRSRFVRSAGRARSATAFVAALVALSLSFGQSMPASAVTMVTSRAARAPMVETQHNIYAAVRAVTDTDWQGTVTFDHSVTFQGRRQLRHSTRVTVQLWRRFCDLGGCVETDLSVNSTAAPDQQWQADLARGRVALATVAAHIDRYRVESGSYQKIDSAVVHVPLVLTVSKTSDKFQQALVANTASLSTTSMTRQVQATLQMALGEMAIAATSATAGAAIITTALRG